MPPMAAGLGGNIPALFSGIFGFGVALAALGGVAAGPMLGLYPGMDTEILIPAFIVIVIGGMGSLRGAFVGSLLIGIADTFGKAYFPSLALFLIYLAMVLVLLMRPQGLFGIKYSDVSVAPAVTAVSAPATMRTRAAGLIALLALLALPFAISDYPRALVAEIFIFAIFAMSLDLLLGFTGLMSLGHAAFFGLGAYAVAVLGTMFGVNAWIGLVAGVDAGGRRRGADRLLLRPHRRHPVPDADARLLAARVLGRAEMARRHRRLGRAGDRREAELLRLRSVQFARHVFHGADLLRSGLLGLLRRLLNAPLGHVFVGIRENEQRMLAIGYPTRAYKLLSFTIAGALAGLSGGLYAIFNGFISPDALYWTASGDVLIMTMLGGAGTLIGPAIGAGVFLLMKNVVSSYSEHWLAIIGITFICCVMFFPAASGARCAASDGGGRRHERAAHRPSQRSFGSLVVTDDVNLDRCRGRAARHHRPERRRQDQPDQSDRRAARAELRPHLRRRTRTSPASRPTGSAAWASRAPSSATTCSRT